MPLPFCRRLLPLALAALCCSCSTPEERASEAFAELCAGVNGLRAELALVVDAESAEQALPALENRAESLREILHELDALADDEDMTPEARHRVGELYREPLQAALESALEEARRVLRRALYHSRGLEGVCRREMAHYSTKGVHPWPRAVLAGREYRPKLKSDAGGRSKEGAGRK